MSAVAPKLIQQRVPVSISIDDIAESIWKLPHRDRETLEDLLEERFVKTVLRRAKEIPELRRKNQLLSLKQIRQEFTRQ